MRWLVLDFETASAQNLKRVGAYKYAACPTTEILCMTWKTDRAKEGVWFPGEPCPFPEEVLASWNFVAHNAAFERNIWMHIMAGEFCFPEIPLGRWSCTMARCLQLALPAALEKVLPVLKLPIEKDMEGNKLTLSMSKTNKRTGMYPERTPEILKRIADYCMVDTRAQWLLHRRIGWLPLHERAIWELSQEVNDRGIGLDLEFVAAAQTIVDDASRPLADEFQRLTGVKVGQRDRILAWCAAQGVTLKDMTKETLASLLGDSEDTDDGVGEQDPEDADEGHETEHVELPCAVQRALKIRQLIGSASIKKLKAMRECVGYDGRARGLMIYHGTTPGRQSAKLLQPHNFPKGSIKEDGEAPDPEALVSLVKTGDYRLVEDCHGPAVEVIVSSLRHAMHAPAGKTFFSGDYSGIQLRNLLAIAGQWDKLGLLASGHNVYIDMAELIYGRPITKADKQEYTLGKNAVLGLGFQMGAVRFHEKYGQGQSLEFTQRAVNTYRIDWAPAVPLLWRQLQFAAVDAVWTGQPQESHGVEYFLRDSALVARVANGSEIHYQMPQKTRKRAPWSTEEEPKWIRGFSYQVQKQGRWITREAFGGQLTENIVMKLEREIMEAAKQRLRCNGYEIVLEVHDEIIAEVPRGRDLAEYQQIMEDVDPWVRHLQIPIAVECWEGSRYKK